MYVAGMRDTSFASLPRALHRVPLRISHAEIPLDSAERSFERDVHEGLGRDPKSIPSQYLYDARGSDLFREIMDLPEYYPTRAEREILTKASRELAVRLAGGSWDVIDLGAGDGAKSLLLLEELTKVADVRYRPIDVSEAALGSVIHACAKGLPGLDTHGVVAEYGDGIRWLAENGKDRNRLVLCLGSNVGNLDDDVARAFFRSLNDALCTGDHVLVGFDLLKDVSVLQRAYDDSAGVTAEFNVNLLRRINRELGGSFDPSSFRHFATFSPKRRAMESYLLSLRKQSVEVSGRVFDFDVWEPIHTEISRKYRESEIAQFARDAEFDEVLRLTDERRFFMDCLWRVGSGTAS
jgi:L-histidine N-alpha-methyltransferase